MDNQSILFPSLENCIGKTLESVPFSAQAWVLIQLLKQHHGDIIAIAENDEHANSLEVLCKQYHTQPEDVLQFAKYDTEPYEKKTPQTHAIAKRLQVLSCLTREPKRKHIIITQAPAVLQYLVPKDHMEKSGIILKKAQEYALENLVIWLQNNGYTRMENVGDQGEFSRRGNIIDIFPSNEDMAVRLDFLDNTIESIKILNVNTQRSQEEKQEIFMAVGREILLNEENKQRLYTAYQQAFHVSRLDDSTYQKMMDGVYVHGIQYYLPLFYEKTNVLMDYSHHPIIVQSIESKSLIKNFLEQAQAYYNARLENKEKVLPPEWLWLKQADIEHYKTITLSSQISDNPQNITMPTHALYLPKSGIEGLKSYVAQYIQKIPIVITAQTIGSLERICEESGLTQATPWHANDDVPKAAGLYKMVLELPQSITISNCAYISEQDILGERKRKILKSRIKPQDVIKHVGMIEEGDIVVHETHGIGRYQGMEIVTVEGLRHDCLKILYQGGDTLLVPVENIETIGRFGGDGEDIKLDKLGGIGFLKRKAKLKETLKDMAYDLLKVAAIRHNNQGLLIPYNIDHYDAFCKKFQHVETEDQRSTIEAIEHDFKEGKISDRLICGDVGFGKTEVALRAAFLVADAGYQVAIFTPTTLLANQHYKTFSERFEGTGKTIVQLSRLTSHKSKEIKEKIKNANADIIIGTHALLGKGLDFPNLGLLIVDEEQNFGVVHKEKIKELKSNIHVLTLTATPIPRTLQMALTGVRDLSIMATPPMERLPIRTITSIYDSLMIKEAILREKQRNGQIFYVCPRLKDLETVYERLSSLLPTLKIQIVHGQLPSSTLEANMTAFIEGKADILLATNIIESGLDIPNANTIIIHRANMFGLAQLYQLRGRVGRGKIRAFAYCTTEDDAITEQAKKRLEVIQSLDSLGAGFTLAQYDLDMRGAGNLLGDEQSGHIKDIGIDLYQKMLEEEINKAKRGDKASMDTTDINVRLTMPIPIYIPEAYVSSISTRMALYRKLSNIKTIEDIKDIKEEMIDRFGIIPEPMENLMYTLLLKEKAKQASIEEIKAGGNAIVIKFYNNTVHNVEGLIKFVENHKNTIKIRSDQHIVYTKESKTASAMLENITEIIQQLAPLQQKP